MSGCDDYRSMVPLFLDDELSGNDAEDFRKHIASCTDCRQLLAEEQELSQLLHRTRPLYQASEALRARVSRILFSEVHSGVRAPERLRRRILRILVSPLRGFAEPTLRWKQVTAVALVTIMAFLFIPQMLQRVRANAFVETAAATHRSYLEGNLPMEIQTSSPAVVTAWFAGKVPFHFQLPESQQAASGQQAYRLVGSRLVSFKGTYAALTTYNMKDQKISLLVVSDKSAGAEGGEEVKSGGLTFHDHTVGDFKVITWSNHGLTYALVSSLPGSARQSCLVCHQNMADHLGFSQHP
ncbi:MAG TPA: zf-HC2 domain-containing protein [Alloacidobacterium sp.]|nr:zf-HC2 domain-containing protein [Alloacidobacterium sp.]